MAKIKMLVFGDTHIPDRAYAIPREIVEWIDREKPFDIAIHTGDLTEEEVLEYVKSLAPRVYIVQGNMDYLELPEKQVFDIYGLRIGVVHGDQVYPRGCIPKLSRIAKKLSVNVLISGHTHAPFITVDQGILHLNPGSVTGVPSGAGGTLIPSLMLVYVDPEHVVEALLFEYREQGLELVRRERFKLAPLTA